MRAFDKIELLPGEEKKISFTLTEQDFCYYNICLRDWHVESGKYEILIGASSADIRLQSEFDVEYISDYSINKIATDLLQMQADSKS